MTTDTSEPRTRSPFDLFVALMAGVAFALVLVGIVNVVHDDDPAQPKLLSAEDAAAAGLPVVRLGEMYIAGDLAIDAGTSIVVANDGTVPHNLAVENGPRTIDLNGGDAVEFDVSTLAPASYVVFCAIEGHRAAGMEAQLAVG
jgi:plastocyanin